MLVLSKRNLLHIGYAGLGLAVGFRLGELVTTSRMNKTMPYIGIDFVDREDAERQRRDGELDQELIYSACKDAVSNYYTLGLSRADGKVSITLAPRGDFPSRKRTEKPKLAPSCDPG